MQPGNVELVGEIIDALNRGNVEAMLARIAPDFEWTPLEGSPVAHVYRGHEQVRRYVEDWLATFDILRLELEEPSELGDHVVVVVRRCAEGPVRSGGLELVHQLLERGEILSSPRRTAAAERGGPATFGGSRRAGA
jgi:ketosteroid isomerase-like protein